MGRQLGRQELARADFIIRPNITGIGATDFERQKSGNSRGERATLAAIPAIKAALAARRASLMLAPATALVEVRQRISLARDRYFLHLVVALSTASFGRS